MRIITRRPGETDAEFAGRRRASNVRGRFSNLLRKLGIKSAPHHRVYYAESFTILEKKHES